MVMAGYCELTFPTQVDTDLDSAVSSKNSSDDDDDYDLHDGYGGNVITLPFINPDDQPQPKVAATRASNGKQSRDVLWASEYFYITKPPHGISGIRTQMRSFVQSSIASSTNLSKYLTPSHFGESLDHCNVTILLLRAWAVWRVYSEHWATEKQCRLRYFQEEWISVQSAIHKVQSNNGGSLGHKKADSMWQLCHRDIVKLMQ